MCITDFWTLRDRKKGVKRKTISENGHCWWRVKVDFDAARLRENFGTEISLRPEPRNLDQSGDGSSVGPPEKTSNKKALSISTPSNTCGRCVTVKHPYC